jgi:hypothetical protein
MSTARRRGWIALAGASMMLTGITAGFGSVPAALAMPGRIVDMGAQCRAQYPGDADFLPAEAYLVAPRDAYSWRCRRISISPRGGIVTDLAVDPDAYCTRLGIGHAVISAIPPNWECIS